VHCLQPGVCSPSLVVDRRNAGIAEVNSLRDEVCRRLGFLVGNGWGCCGIQVAQPTSSVARSARWKQLVKRLPRIAGDHDCGCGPEAIAGGDTSDPTIADCDAFD
jgi:hypothetical protein